MKITLIRSYILSIHSQQCKSKYGLSLILLRIIDMTAKENAIEDCIVSLKKAYEKEKITMPEFLQNVRKLANK
jgi:Vps23 core domain